LDISVFAQDQGFKVRRDGCDHPIIQGRTGDIFGGYDGGLLGVYLNLPTARKWNSARRAMQAAGLTLRQDAETEGVFAFNPEDKVQARVAIKFSGVKPKRQISPEQKVVLAKRAAHALSVRRGIEAHNAAQA
jgi:hypothetical protein